MAKATGLNFVAVGERGGHPAWLLEVELSHTILGWIEWYAVRQCYILRPEFYTNWSPDHLRDVADQRRGGIPYCDETWNPAIGCSPASAGCANCWAQRQALRQCGVGGLYHGLVDEGRWTGRTRLNERVLDAPMRWREPRTVLVASMGDLFHESRSDADIDRVFAVMALAPQHRFLVLTKRAERMRDYVADETAVGHKGTGLRVWHQQLDVATEWDLARTRPGCRYPSEFTRRGQEIWPLPNVRIGVSVEDQATADERYEALRDTPAALRWWSVEPCLGPIPHLSLEGIGHVVVGGESGPHARPCDVAWLRDIVRQCKAAGVAVYVKQLGANPFDGGVDCGFPNSHFGARAISLCDRAGADPSEWPSDLNVREVPRE